MSKKKTITPFYQLLVLWQVTNILLILFYRRYKNYGFNFLQAVCFILLVSIFCAADCLLYVFIMHIVECLRHLERTVPHKSESDKKHSRVSLNQTRHAGHAPVDEYRIYIQQHQCVLK